MSAAPDPGWGAALRAALVPLKGARMAQAGAPALLVMRALWFTFFIAVLLLGVVVAIVGAQLPGGGVDGRVAAGVVVAISVLAQVVAGAFIPPISGRTVDEVRGTAQRAFFLRVALAEPGALLGFMGFALSGNAAVYLAGAVVSIAGLFDAAPGTRWLERGQDQLRESGSSVDLLDALVRAGVTR